MSAILSQEINPKGLHQKYIVAHADGSPVDPMATYFVLRLDHFGRDGQHTAASRAAARAYACHLLATNDAEHLWLVAKQLQSLVDNLEQAGR